MRILGTLGNMPSNFLPRRMYRTHFSRLVTLLCFLCMLFVFTLFVNKFFWAAPNTYPTVEVLKPNNQPIQDLQGPIDDHNGKIAVQPRKQEQKEEETFFEYFHPPMEICASVKSYGGFMVEFKRLLINTTAIEGNLGGEDYQSVMFQAEASEYVKLSKNTFAVECPLFYNLDK
ncbi:unnamed protein product [Dibothriocephalus latus]|uniref:Uncharacterized protein n=1 Tax=Dibothriocephalus latus TaxID=60516 RepID=A0A3P7MBI4_DIBLA|nr:unnamed protein product [Dibothriocephalus latus]